MAVILQPLVGEATADGYFHPTLAGVANSVDFYPLPHTAPAHGCASIALGLGKSVVDGSAAVHFSLGDPGALTGPDAATLPVSALKLDSAAGRPSDVLAMLHGRAAQTLVTLPTKSSVILAPEAARSLTASLSQDVHGERVVFKKAYGDVVEESATPAAASDALQPVALPNLLAGEVHRGIQIGGGGRDGL